MRTTSAPLAALLLAAAPVALAAGSRLAPLPKGEATVVHSPYEVGACEVCHARADPADPGPATVTNDTCTSCHEEFAGKTAVKLNGGKVHPIKGTCTGCHSPHNSKKRKLLL